MEVNEKKRYFIMDGNAYVYRAYYAIEELSTSTGIPTNAIFGFTRLLLKILLEDAGAYGMTVIRHTGVDRRQSFSGCYDVPVEVSRSARVNQYASSAVAESIEIEEYLDIPAFLRRQAD